MGLTQASLRKWARELFSAAAAPMRVEVEAEASLRAQIEAKVEGREGLRVAPGHHPYHSSHDKADWACVLELLVDDPTRSYGSETYGFEIDSSRQLHLRVGRAYGRDIPTFPIASPAQIDALFDRVEEERSKVILRAAKKDKRRRLAERALRAQLEPIARAHRLAFALESNATGVKLHLEWPDKRPGQLFIPWKNTEEALGVLEALLVPLSRASELGMKVHTKASSGGSPLFLKWHRFHAPESE